VACAQACTIRVQAAALLSESINHEPTTVATTVTCFNLIFAVSTEIIREEKFCDSTRISWCYLSEKKKIVFFIIELQSKVSRVILI
jgi:hypothetical protein